MDTTDMSLSVSSYCLRLLTPRLLVFDTIGIRPYDDEQVKRRAGIQYKHTHTHPPNFLLNFLHKYRQFYRSKEKKIITIILLILLFSCPIVSCSLCYSMAWACALRRNIFGFLGVVAVAVVATRVSFVAWTNMSVRLIQQPQSDWAVLLGIWVTKNFFRAVLILAIHWKHCGGVLLTTLIGVIACTGVITPKVWVASMEVSTIGCHVPKMHYTGSAFLCMFIVQMKIWYMYIMMQIMGNAFRGKDRGLG